MNATTKTALVILSTFASVCSGQVTGTFANSLLEHKQAFSKGVCQGLNDAYTELHQSIISGKSPQRYVVFVSPPSGIADRLLGLAGAFMVALLTRRALLVAPRPMAYELFYDQPFINWTLPAATVPEDVLGPVLWPPRTRECERCSFVENGAIETYMNCDICEDDGHSVTYLNWINDFLTRPWHMTQDFNTLFPDVHTIYYSGNRGTSVGMFLNLHHQRQLYGMGLRPDTTFGCIYNYLLFPRPEVLELVREELQKLQASELTIGVQVRTDDRYMEAADMPVEYAKRYRGHFTCAEKLEAALQAESGRVRWFLVSDSIVVRQQALNWYGDKLIVYLRSNPRHVSSPGTSDMKSAQLAVAEHWLFGMTDYQVIAFWSGYGRTAAMRSLRGMSVIALGGTEEAENCGPEMLESPWKLGEGYSGIRRSLLSRQRLKR